MFSCFSHKIWCRQVWAPAKRLWEIYMSGISSDWELQYGSWVPILRAWCAWKFSHCDLVYFNVCLLPKNTWNWMVGLYLDIWHVGCLFTHLFKGLCKLAEMVCNILLKHKFLHQSVLIRAIYKLIGGLIKNKICRANKWLFWKNCLAMGFFAMLKPVLIESNHKKRMTLRA